MNLLPTWEMMLLKSILRARYDFNYNKYVWHENITSGEEDDVTPVSAK